MGNKHHGRGAATEHIVAAHFLSNGYEVYWPSIAQSRADFIVFKDDIYSKVQVKSAHEESRNGHRYVRARLSKPSRGTRPYEPEDFDILAVSSSSGLWLIPFDELPKQASFCVDKHGPNTRPWTDYNPDNWKVK